MKGDFPLGQREGPRLVVLPAESLNDPLAIARQAVGLLNAEGGEVWIGLREEGGVVSGWEGVQEAPWQAHQLRDFLFDSLEPSLFDSELEVELVELAERSPVLALHCRPESARRPYALSSQGGRHSLIRVGDRTRLLSRPEIAKLFQKAEERRDAVAATEAALRMQLERERQDSISTGSAFLWLHLEPVDLGSRLDLEGVRNSDYLIDPAATGNRRGGSNFTAAYQLGRLEPIVSGDAESAYLFVGREDAFELRIDAGSRITFKVPLVSLLIHPFARDEVRTQLGSDDLLEYPISVFRLAAHLFSDARLWSQGQSPEATVLAQLAIFGLKGWGLRPRSLRSAGEMWRYGREPIRVFPDDDFVLEPPIRLSAREIREAPDACGFRLIRRLYLAFGYALDDLPPEFDRRLGKLFIPG